MTPANLVSPVARIAAAVTATATVTATRSNTTRSTSSRGSSLLARSLRARERSLEATDHFPREPLFISLPRTIANPFGCFAGSSIHEPFLDVVRVPKVVERNVAGGPLHRGRKKRNELSRGESAGDPDRKTLGERQRRAGGGRLVVREEGRTDSVWKKRRRRGRTERERAGSTSDTIPGSTRAGTSVYRARTTSEPLTSDRSAESRTLQCQSRPVTPSRQQFLLDFYENVDGSITTLGRPDPP